MDNMDVVQPSFPPQEQEQLFELIRNRLGISKYIDLIRTIKRFLEEDKDQATTVSRKRKAKGKYDNYVKSSVGRCFSAEELDQKNNGKNILGALKGTDLHSDFVRNEMERYLEGSHVQGSYFDYRKLEEGLMPEREGMTEADGKVLNYYYIAPTVLIPAGEKGRPSKEEAANFNTDSMIHNAEDAMHDIEMQIVRNEKLQCKLEFIIDQQYKRKNKGHEIDVDLILKSPPNNRKAPKTSEEVVFYDKLNQALLNKKGEPQNPQSKESLEISGIELAALADLYMPEKKSSQRNVTINEESKAVVIRIREHLRSHPEKTAKHLLSLVKTRHCTLQRMKQNVIGDAAKTMGTRYLNSIRRKSDTIKQREYPFLTNENLLREITSCALGVTAPKSSFIENGDDVSTQLKCHSGGGLVMQIESVRWHKDAFELLQVGTSPALCEKIRRFIHNMKILFDVKIEHNTCTRVHGGDFDGLELYGDERLYLAIRLYHILLVRLQTAFLQAEVDVAEYEFRKHCNEVGKARLMEKNPNAFLTEEAKIAMGLPIIKLPPTEGTGIEKMGRFLDAVKKRETIHGRSNPYSVSDFESDVMWAIGVEGNKLFTLPRILARIREAVNQIIGVDLELYEKYFEQERNGVPGSETKYEDEVFRASKEWLFAFECRYSDNFVVDDWGTGEYGDVCRLTAKIVKAPVSSRDGEDDVSLENGKRPNTGPSRGRVTKKKKRSLKSARTK